MTWLEWIMLPMERGNAYAVRERIKFYRATRERVESYRGLVPKSFTRGPV